MIFEEYYNKLTSVLEQVKNTQKEKIASAASVVAETIEKDGIIYIFGCGHSHLLGLDCFYRAGGLVNVSAMLDTDLMLYNGAAKSSKMEKMSGIAESIFERYCITKNDVLITVSTSEKNAVPCEMAEVATKNGVLAVCLAEGKDIETACKYAVCASGLSVTKKGVLNAIPTREEIERMIINE